MKWRVITTDTESATGVAPYCEAMPGHHESEVQDCCPHPRLECWTESAATSQAATLTAYDAEPCQ